MAKHKAVLFDYDGTIVDTNQYIIDSWQYMASRTMGERRFDVDYLVRYFGTPLLDAMEIAARDYGIEGFSAEELCAIYREYQKCNPNMIGPVFPGVAESVKKLKEDGVLLGIVTSRFNRDTMGGLERYDILKYFDAIVGADDTLIHKPLPEPCLICCKKLGVDPRDAVMVGDSRFDMECANNAGADSAFVAWSFCTKLSDLSGISAPDFYIENGSQLAELL